MRPPGALARFTAGMRNLGGTGYGECGCGLELESMGKNTVKEDEGRMCESIASDRPWE